MFENDLASKVLFNRWSTLKWMELLRISSEEKSNGKAFCQLRQVFCIGETKYFLKVPLRRLTHISMARPGLCCHPQSNTGPGKWGYITRLDQSQSLPCFRVEILVTTWTNQGCLHGGSEAKWISSRHQMVSLTVGKCILSLIQQIFIEHLLGHTPRFTKMMMVMTMTMMMMMMIMMCWEGGGDTGVQTITVSLPLTTKWKSLDLKKKP